jgi:putative phosphoribosyl transferase
MVFRDRRDAGEQLAERVAHLDLHDPVVLALPRGGVPVAAPIAERLGAPLDVLVVRKVGVPGHEELGLGAVSEGGKVVIDEGVSHATGVSADRFEELAEVELEELRRRVHAYRGDRELPDLAGRDVVLVDDGIATGGTVRAALLAVRDRAAHRVVVVAPVGAGDSVAHLEEVADQVICLRTPIGFTAVGLEYERFDQTTDDEVVELLDAARRATTGRPG